MNDCEYLTHWHLLYALPVWTLGTWALLLLLAWCLVGLKRQTNYLIERMHEVQCRQDAYFGIGGSWTDAESIRIRDMEVRRLRGEKVEDDDRSDK